ncbi:2-hydroxycyclohexanecarboxyl-CoA dehydrogenase [bacterium SCGC AG-212-C10]|nr:2-hydroxycyclohexanecarboxyl-CoA dehydrogenase [bacterium SCGC AG-212-C10]
MQRLEGKVAVVTGGGSGIGRAISLRLASEGATVVIGDINAAGAAETASLIAAQETSPEAAPRALDVTSYDSAAALAESVRSEFGRVDILVNNAGWDRIIPFLKTEPDFWDKVIAINLRGVIHCTHAMLPAMVEQGGGAIVTISSDAGRVGSSGEAVYSACKAGVIGFTKTVAREMARHQIRLNVVCPGPTNTPLVDEITAGENGAKIIAAMTRAVPFGRMGEPDDIAGAVAFFASDDASFCTGQVLSVSGGLSMVG